MVYYDCSFLSAFYQSEIENLNKLYVVTHAMQFITRKISITTRKRLRMHNLFNRQHMIENKKCSAGSTFFLTFSGAMKHRKPATATSLDK